MKAFLFRMMILGCLCSIICMYLVEHGYSGEMTDDMQEMEVLSISV